MQRKCIPTFYDNWNWPYEDALTWMNDAHRHCLYSGQDSIAIGAHSKNIVTLGRHAKWDEIIDADFLRKNGVDVIQVERGGGATVHGPGQVVLYPVVSLNRLAFTIPEFTTLLEEAILSCLLSFNIRGERISGQPGIFVNGAKVGSVGLRISQGLVTHGISLNVSNDLSLFGKIATCGKVNATITSMAALLGVNLDVTLVGHRLRELLKL